MLHVEGLLSRGKDFTRDVSYLEWGYFSDSRLLVRDFSSLMGSEKTVDF